MFLRDEHRKPLAEMDSDPDVMHMMGGVISADESAASFQRAVNHEVDHGVTFWAVELLATGEFIGLIGLARIGDDLPFKGALEVGWRLRKEYWGQGLAPEGAAAALAYGFSKFDDDLIYAFTADDNKPSERVMQKLGMKRRSDLDFTHPRLGPDSPLAPHIVYAIQRGDFQGLRPKMG